MAPRNLEVIGRELGAVRAQRDRYAGAPLSSYAAGNPGDLYRTAEEAKAGTVADYDRQLAALEAERDARLQYQTAPEYTSQYQADLRGTQGPEESYLYQTREGATILAPGGAKQAEQIAKNLNGGKGRAVSYPVGFDFRPATAEEIKKGRAPTLGAPKAEFFTINSRGEQIKDSSDYAYVLTPSGKQPTFLLGEKVLKGYEVAGLEGLGAITAKGTLLDQPLLEAKAKPLQALGNPTPRGYDLYATDELGPTAYSASIGLFPAAYESISKGVPLIAYRNLLKESIKSGKPSELILFEKGVAPYTVALIEESKSAASGNAKSIVSLGASTAFFGGLAKVGLPKKLTTKTELYQITTPIETFRASTRTQLRIGRTTLEVPYNAPKAAEGLQKAIVSDLGSLYGKEPFGLFSKKGTLEIGKPKVEIVKEGGSIYRVVTEKPEIKFAEGKSLFEPRVTGVPKVPSVASAFEISAAESLSISKSSRSIVNQRNLFSGKTSSADLTGVLGEGKSLFGKGQVDVTSYEGFYGGAVKSRSLFSFKQEFNPRQPRTVLKSPFSGARAEELRFAYREFFKASTPANRARVIEIQSRSSIGRPGGKVAASSKRLFEAYKDQLGVTRNLVYRGDVLDLNLGRSTLNRQALELNLLRKGLYDRRSIGSKSLRGGGGGAFSIGNVDVGKFAAPYRSIRSFPPTEQEVVLGKSILRGETSPIYSPEAGGKQAALRLAGDIRYGRKPVTLSEALTVKVSESPEYDFASVTSAKGSSLGGAGFARASAREFVPSQKFRQQLGLRKTSVSQASRLSLPTVQAARLETAQRSGVRIISASRLVFEAKVRPEVSLKTGQTLKVGQKSQLGLREISSVRVQQEQSQKIAQELRQELRQEQRQEIKQELRQEQKVQLRQQLRVGSRLEIRVRPEVSIKPTSKLETKKSKKRLSIAQESKSLAGKRGIVSDFFTRFTQQLGGKSVKAPSPTRKNIKDFERSINQGKQIFPTADIKAGKAHYPSLKL